MYWKSGVCLIQSSLNTAKYSHNPSRKVYHITWKKDVYVIEEAFPKLFGTWPYMFSSSLKYNRNITSHCQPGHNCSEVQHKAKRLLWLWGSCFKKRVMLWWQWETVKLLLWQLCQLKGNSKEWQILNSKRCIVLELI